MILKTDVFILTGEWEDLPRSREHPQGRHLLRYYGISQEHGRVEILIDRQKPLFFVPRAAVLPPGVRPSERRAVALRNFAGEEADALYFPTQKALRSAAKTLKALDIPTYEADLKPERRYLMERFINAQATVQGEARQNGRLTTFRNPRLTPCETSPEFTILSFDIETGVESDQLYSIAVHLTGKNLEEQQRVFMLGEFPGAAPEFISFHPTEQKMLEAFLRWFQEADPDILIGWNVIGFDLAFLERKSREWGIPFHLARSGRPINLAKRERIGYTAEISGRVVIDVSQTLRMSFYSFEDYRLETVAQALLGRGKTISSEDEKIAEIERLFREDKGELARYNLQDCLLVSEIVRKTGLLELMVRRSQISGLLLNQVGMSVAAFDHYMLPRLHRKGFVAPNADDITGLEHAAGGYVMEPVPGIYEHVAVLDFKSLYPSIIQSFKIDPLSRLRADIDPLTTPNGYRFSASEHILPEFIDRLMAQRAEARRAGDAHLSQAIKILMNSFYGVMGSFGCRFYHPDLPSAITGTGQWLLKGCKAFLEAQGYPVLYGDTDSVFVQLKMNGAEEKGRELAALLNRYWREELQKMGVVSYLEMEFEKYYHKFVLPIGRATGGGARKRYAGLLPAGGKPVLEFVGMEFVRSDWTPLAKQFQHELYWRVLNGLEYRNWIRGLIDSLLAGRLDGQLVYRKRLRKDADEYTKNISPQVRAARMMKKPGREVRYLVTRDGPVPIERHPRNIDYRHYIEKQLRPIADSLLGLLGVSFRELIRPAQLELF
ncbi:MAG: DNA polymerase II [Calditrichaceae bacterium]|nr:DNA polymerase II [Calditrichia bacterium]NUQ41427.1 DNA polymerase II [Calditrichaceae bacterium]